MRYYILRPVWSDLYTTDNTEIAERLSKEPEYYVIDSQENKQIALDTIGERYPIAEIVEYKE